MIARLVADDSFFTVERVFWKFFQEQLGDQRLSPNIDLKLDVVRFGRIHAERLLKTMPEHFAGGAGRFHCCVEIMGHEVWMVGERSRAAALNHSTSSCAKKTGERKFILSPG